MDLEGTCLCDLKNMQHNLFWELHIDSGSSFSVCSFINLLYFYRGLEMLTFTLQLQWDTLVSRLFLFKFVPWLFITLQLLKWEQKCFRMCLLSRFSWTNLCCCYPSNVYGFFFHTGKFLHLGNGYCKLVPHPFHCCCIRADMQRTNALVFDLIRFCNAPSS